MMEIHSQFKVIKRKTHVAIIDEDNGISVASDMDYALGVLRSVHVVRPGVKVLYCDTFGKWDVIDLDGTASCHSFRGLDAANEAEALRAA